MNRRNGGIEGMGRTQDPSIPPFPHSSIPPFRTLSWVVVTALAVSTTIGCGGFGGSANKMPELSPASSASQAIELFDNDGDGALGASELAECPALLSVMERYDKDGDGALSGDEIAARLTAILSSGSPWMTVDARVLRNGRPLRGATVRFVPAPFLEGALPPAVGQTDNRGRVRPAVADEKLPDDMKGLAIMQPGLYRVEVEHPSVTQPHKPLGCEVDMLVRGGTEPVFNL